MPRMVIVIDFEEPTDDMEMGGIIFRAQETFKQITGVKMHMARAEVAERIIHIFDPIHEEGEEVSGNPAEPEEGG